MAPPVEPDDDVEASGVIEPEPSGEPRCLTKPVVASIACVGLAFAASLCFLVFMLMSAEAEFHKGAKFYVGVTAAEGMLDAAGSPSAATATPSFNLSLRVDNRRADDETCTGNGALKILYAGLDVGWGTVPGLCVPGRDTGEVEVILSHPAGVALSHGMRDRMASDMGAGGGLGFRVEMEVTGVGADVSSRSELCLLRCDVKQGQGFAKNPCDTQLCQSVPTPK
ncbi:unnamed protein product [Urochloa humidicola]